MQQSGGAVASARCAAWSSGLRRSPRARRHRGGCLSYMVARQRRGRGHLAGQAGAGAAVLRRGAVLQGGPRGHRGCADLPGRRAGCDPRSSGRHCCPVCAGSMPGTVAAAQFQPQTFQRHGCSRSRSRSSGGRRTHKRQGGPCGLSCLLCVCPIWFYSLSPGSSAAGGRKPSRAIRSRVAVKI